MGTERAVAFMYLRQYFLTKSLFNMSTKKGISSVNLRYWMETALILTLNGDNVKNDKKNESIFLIKCHFSSYLIEEMDEDIWLDAMKLIITLTEKNSMKSRMLEFFNILKLLAKSTKFLLYCQWYAFWLTNLYGWVKFASKYTYSICTI